MPDMKLPNYFYGDEAMQFTYFRIPCQLITHPRFKHLSTDSELCMCVTMKPASAESYVQKIKQTVLTFALN